MSIKNTPQYEQLKEAMQLIRELEVPEHLQEKALTHLLKGGGEQEPAPVAGGERERASSDGTKELREFIAQKAPKGAVEEIPALLLWAKENEDQVSFSEDDIVTLYRRVNMRPPKHVGQSMRDLSAKRYKRLEADADLSGHVRLSRIGEDFVRHDLPRQKN